jgi:hypothetical protein
MVMSSFYCQFKDHICQKYDGCQLINTCCLFLCLLLPVKCLPCLDEGLLAVVGRWRMP